MSSYLPLISDPSLLDRIDEGLLTNDPIQHRQLLQEARRAIFDLELLLMDVLALNPALPAEPGLQARIDAVVSRRRESTHGPAIESNGSRSVGPG